MTSSKHSSHATSISSTGSLMQEVPGSFPMPQTSEEQPVYHSLSQAVHARRSEYVQPEHVRIKVGTWNVASHKGTEKDLAGWFVQGQGVEEALTGLDVEHQEHVHRGVVPETNGSTEREDVSTQEARYKQGQSSTPKGDNCAVPKNEDIGIYALMLQEVVDVTAVTEALRPYSDPSTARRWKDALEAALPNGYMLIAEQQLIGLLLLVYASPEVGKDIHGISTTSVGTGIGGYMGNKGAVTTRIVLGDTTRIVFINSHLAAGADKAALERRNWDASQIVQRTRFAPLQDVMDLNQSTGEQLGDEDFAFWGGDLNYRLEGIPGDDLRRLLMLHTRNVYDLSQQAAAKVENEINEATKSIERRTRGRSSMGSSVRSLSENSDRTSMETLDTEPTLIDEIGESEDPASLQTTIDSILPHDELQQQMTARKAFHDGWKEGPIRFLPTYKYDVGSVGVFDSSEKKRGPSYCDRILYRTRRDKLAHDAQVAEESKAKKLDEAMRANGTDQAGNDEDILYDYDPDTDGVHDEYDDYDEHEDENVVITKGGFEDELTLESYITHQRVLSSDHKPMDAIFLLKFDRVVPELKAKVHAEVARELDKTENESKPSVTIVIDRQRTDGAGDGPADFQGVWFGDVRWAQMKHRGLTIANTGQVPASFEFIQRPIGAGQDAGIAPSWLNLSIDDEEVDSATSSSKPITLEPGDAVNVVLELRILDFRIIRLLNEGSKDLEDILVLRVDGGRDHFIPVRARWQDTSLGRGIEKLIRIPEGGIRKLQRQSPEGGPTQKLEEKLDKLSLDSPVKFSAPRELFRLTEAIEELCTRVVAEWEMTAAEDDMDAPWERYPGWPLDENAWSERRTTLWSSTVSDLCDALDTDKPLTESFPERLPQMQRLYMLCSLLVIFLRNLPEGVLPQALWTQVEQQLVEFEKSKTKPGPEEERTAIQEILASSPPNNICLILLTTMLDRILRELATTKAHSAEASVDSPTKSKASPLRRVAGIAKLSSSLPDLPDAARRDLCKIIALAAIHPDDSVPEKQKSAHDKRKIALVEMFVKKPDS